MKLDRLLKSATSHVETVRISRTGVNPLLWIVGLAAPWAMIHSVSLALFGGGKGDFFAAAFLLVAIVTIPIAAECYFVIFFLRPEFLESEEYRPALTANERGRGQAGVRPAAKRRTRA